MKRLLIDISHVGKACLYVATDNAYKVTFEGKEVSIPRGEDGYEVFLMSFRKTLRELNMTPQQCILVADGKSCKQMRRSFLPGYCERPAGPKEFMEEFYKMQDMIVKTLLSYGAIYVDKEYVEADDIIFHLAEKLDSIVWSGDADMLACAAPVYYDGFKDTSKFLGIPKDTIVVWKSLVGDTSDKIPGCPGFGKEAFRSMLEKYGDSCLYDIKGMLEDEALDELKSHVADFKPFQKIIDNQETVYNSYKCAKFYHPGYKLNWKMAYPSGDGVFNEWKPVIKLITAKELTDDFLFEFKKQILACPNPAFDIETWMDEESLEWCAKNKSKTGKAPLDIYGAHMAGFSINCGSNNHITYYFPIDHKDTDNLTSDQVITVLNTFDESKPLIVHNSSYELPVVRKHYELRYDRGFLPPLTYDSRILAGFVDEYETPGLKFWSKHLMDYDQITYEQITESGQMNTLTGSHVLHYGCDDSICTAALFKFEEVICLYEDSWKSYIEADLGSQFLYASSFLQGLRFDEEKRKELQAENHIKFEGLMVQIKAFLSKLKKENSTTRAFSVSEVMAKLNKGEALEKEVDTFITAWPGCEYVPAESFSIVAIKRVLKSTGLNVDDIKLRSLPKFLEELYNRHPQTLSITCILSLNKFGRDNFIPDPELNLRSPKQMSDLIYNFLQYPVRIRNKRTEIQKSKGLKGNPASNESAIRHAIAYDATEEEKELLLTIMSAKSCLTEDSLFYSPYENFPNPKSGRVHYNSGQSLTKSGRPATSKPNIGQVSKKSRVREVYVSDEDYLWGSLDFNSQELVHVAVHSGDENMLSCFKGDRRDIHCITGAAIYSMQYSEVAYELFKAMVDDELHTNYKQAKEVRNKAKSVNFLDVYLGTAKTLGEKLLTTEDVAQGMLDAKAEMFPDVKKWQQNMIDLHIERGYAVEPMGKRRHLRLDGTWKDKHELRSSINHIIQGGSATQTKIAMSKIWYSKILERYDAKFCFPVYDEIDVTAKREVMAPFLKELHGIMVENYAGFPVEFKSEIKIGKSFGQLKKVGTEPDEAKILAVIAEIDKADKVEEIDEEEFDFSAIEDVMMEGDEVEYHG